MYVYDDGAAVLCLGMGGWQRSVQDADSDVVWEAGSDVVWEQLTSSRLLPTAAPSPIAAPPCLPWSPLRSVSQSFVATAGARCRPWHCLGEPSPLAALPPCCWHCCRLVCEGSSSSISEGGSLREAAVRRCVRGSAPLRQHRDGTDLSHSCQVPCTLKRMHAYTCTLQGIACDRNSSTTWDRDFAMMP